MGRDKRIFRGITMKKFVYISIFLFFFHFSLISENPKDNKDDFKKKEIYEYINNVYSKNMDLVNKIYIDSMDRQKDVFATLNLIMYGFAIIIALLGAAGIYKSHLDRKFLERLINSETETYQKQLDIKSEKIKELENKIRKFSDEIDLIRKDVLWTIEIQNNFKKISSIDQEQIIDGITKIADNNYYSPQIYRKIKELTASKNDSIKITALRALSVFGDQNAFRNLKKMAKNNKEAETTLKHLKEEFPEL